MSSTQSQALIPTREGRPATVMIAGITIYVSVRDAEFERVALKLYKILCAHHPDRRVSELLARTGGRNFARANAAKINGTTYRKKCAHLGQFLYTERENYAQIGLLPPKWERWKSWCAEEIHPVARTHRHGSLPDYMNRPLAGEYGLTHIESRARAGTLVPPTRESQRRAKLTT